MKVSAYNKIIHVHITEEEFVHLAKNNSLDQEILVDFSGDWEKGLVIQQVYDRKKFDDRGKVVPGRYAARPGKIVGYHALITPHRTMWGGDKIKDGVVAVDVDLTQINKVNVLFVRKLNANNRSEKTVETHSSNKPALPATPTTFAENEVILQPPTFVPEVKIERERFIEQPIIQQPTLHVQSSFLAPAPVITPTPTSVVKSPSINQTNDVDLPSDKINELKHLCAELNTILREHPHLYVVLDGRKLILEEEVDALEEL